MKDFIFKLAFLIVLFIVIPSVLILLFSEDISFDKTDGIIRVYDVEDDKITEMMLDDYIVGVVAAEVPASFHYEAIKAQAVAARTYTLYKQNNLLPEHGGADVCTDFAHCQAYCNEDKMKENWGADFKENLGKIKSAVDDTRGEYISYDGKPINAVFHSCSDGMTENSADVWGGDFVYLKSVESPGDSRKKDYVSESIFEIEEVEEIVEGEIDKDVDSQSEVIGEIVRSSGGNVEMLSLYGINFKGTDLRRMFSLKSASFEIYIDGNTVTFRVYGSGHGVGMSQYGANGFANDGYDYRQILGHYYQGTEVVSIN